MNPKKSGFEMTFDVVSLEKLFKQMQELGIVPLSEEELKERRRAAATQALESLNPEDLTHEQRVGLYARLVELLAAGG